jgi:hypothetical protein
MRYILWRTTIQTAVISFKDSHVLSNRNDMWITDTKIDLERIHLNCPARWRYGRGLEWGHNYLWRKVSNAYKDVMSMSVPVATRRVPDQIQPYLRRRMHKSRSYQRYPAVVVAVTPEWHHGLSELPLQDIMSIKWNQINTYGNTIAIAIHMATTIRLNCHTAKFDL